MKSLESWTLGLAESGLSESATSATSHIALPPIAHPLGMTSEALPGELALLEQVDMLSMQSEARVWSLSTISMQSLRTMNT